MSGSSAGTSNIWNLSIERESKSPYFNTCVQFCICSINSKSIRRLNSDSFREIMATWICFLFFASFYWIMNLTTSCTVQPYVAEKARKKYGGGWRKRERWPFIFPNCPLCALKLCCHADGCIHSSMYTQPYKERDQKGTCVNALAIYGQSRMSMYCTVILGI